MEEMKRPASHGCGGTSTEPWIAAARTRPPRWGATAFIGIDVHKQDSQVCILSEEGDVMLEQ
jgi:hypothetical protein